MRAVLICLIVATPILTPSWAAATDTDRKSDTESQPLTGRDLEIARLQLRLFENVEYPLRLSKINARITLLETQIEMLKDRITEYQRFDTKAFFVTLQQTRLRLLDAEQQLRIVRRERVLLQLHARDAVRLRKLMIQRGAEATAQ